MNEEEISHKLRMMGKEIPKELKDRGIITMKPLEKQKEALKKMRDHHSTPKEVAAKLDKRIASGMYDRVKEVVDPRINKKISDIMDGKIKAARERGDLPGRREAARMYDQFMRSRKK